MVIDVGVDFVTINELAHTALVLCQKLRLCRLHVYSPDVAMLMCILTWSFYYTVWTIKFFYC